MAKRHELINEHFSSAPAKGASVTVDLRNADAFNEMESAILDALRDVFEGSVIPEAKGRCPVGTDPIEPGSARNRDSIGVYVWETARGPMAKLFSSSGHGGFVEVGTVHMSGQPYAWPAVQTHIPTVMAKIKENLAAVKSQPGGIGISRVIEEEPIR